MVPCFFGSYSVYQSQPGVGGKLEKPAPPPRCFALACMDQWLLSAGYYAYFRSRFSPATVSHSFALGVRMGPNRTQYYFASGRLRAVSLSSARANLCPRCLPRQSRHRFFDYWLFARRGGCFSVELPPPSGCE